MNINTLIKNEKKPFDKFYNTFLKSTLSRSKLSKAMLYGSINGGKRIRPFIINNFSKIAKIKKNKYYLLSSAVECIHSYSLIHDDLPSMDNDDFRRGKLSTHKKFDEATAILAGDALHDLAFEILSNKKLHVKPEVRILLIKNLSIALGFKGLAGGQSSDLLFENNIIRKKDILNMYHLKTSKLFGFCASSPFILAEKKQNEIKFAEEYGILFGLIFQIVDDILDETKDFKSIGKTPGKDIKQGKSTIISLIGKKNSIKLCLELIEGFNLKYKFFLNKYKILNEILLYNINRIN